MASPSPLIMLLAQSDKSLGPGDSVPRSYKENEATGRLDMIRNAYVALRLLMSQLSGVNCDRRRAQNKISSLPEKTAEIHQTGKRRPYGR